MAVELDTTSVAPPERLRFWRDGLRKLLDVDARIEGPTASPLGMHLTVRKLASCVWSSWRVPKRRAR